MMEYIDALLSADPGEILALIAGVINNPLSNVQASLLLLIALVILTLLAILVAILVLGYRDEHSEDGVESDAGDVVGRARVSATSTRDSSSTTVRESLSCEERGWRVATSVLIVLGCAALAWLLSGVTTGSEGMCLSCHRADVPHVERSVSPESSDPHQATACIRCHESGGVVAGLTTGVPGRVLHFAQGVLTPQRMTRYGRPIALGACVSCHGDVAERTLTVEARGLRVSHREPLDAGALCTDCHELQAVSGIVGSYTIGMSSCLRCHDNEQASAQCSSCHVKDIAYAMHVNRQPTPRRLVPDKPTCGTCHDQDRCDACHGIRMPHTREFVVSEHPRVATLDTWYNDGKTCAKCHTESRNPCTACHRKNPPGHPRSVWPREHGASGPAAGVGACNDCHGYLARIAGRNFCGVCHEEHSGLRQ